MLETATHAVSSSPPRVPATHIEISNQNADTSRHQFDFDSATPGSTRFVSLPIEEANRALHYTVSKFVAFHEQLMTCAFYPVNLA